MLDPQRRTTHLLIWTGHTLFTVAVVILVATAMFGTRVEYPAGTAVTTMPMQRNDGLPGSPWQLEEYTIRPLARFRIEALVLSSKRYFLQSDSWMSEVDLALGWGPMSNDAVLGDLKIWQRGRWYYYRWNDQPPIAPRDIVAHSTNLHTVPASDEVRQQIRQIRPGDVVLLEGYLVEISREDGWRWTSSLSRNDSGNGACELMWVERVVWK